MQKRTAKRISRADKEITRMIGYKAFDKNLCCRGFQFEVGFGLMTKDENIEKLAKASYEFADVMIKVRSQK
jgi:hypothetical protein